MSSIFNALFRSVSVSAAPTPAPAPAPAPAQPSAKVDAPPPAPSPADQPRPRVVSEPISPKISTAANTSSAERFPPSPYSAGHGQPSVHTHSPMGQGNPLGDLSYDTSYSDTTDILLPRGVPFVHRRHLHAQAEVDGTPIKGANPAFYQPSTPARGRSIVIRDPSDPAPPKVEEKKPVQLTEWRKEQIRRQNQPRLMEPIVPKPIPALHGPPNLPYARNPSGVDSSIPDDNTADHNFHAAQAELIALQNPYTQQTSYERQATPALVQPSMRPATRVPYQQYAETANLIQGDGGYYKPTGPAPAQVLYAAKSNKPESRLTPSEMLRAQMHSLPPARPLEPITEHPIHPVHAVPVTRPIYMDIGRKGTTSVTAPATPAAQKIVDDVDTYPTTPRYVAEHDAKVAKPEAITTKATSEEESAAAKTLANSKADASANWRLKTPAKGTASGARVTSFGRYTSSADRSDDAPTMTIDTLFEKFAPSSGSSPITIKVNTPPHADPAVKEVSQTPFHKPNPDPRLLRAPSPDLSVTLPTPAANATLTAGEAAVEDLITLDSEPDENTAPKRPAVRKTTKAKGTPGAGKHLKRSGAKLAGKDEAEAAVPVAGSPVKPKAPLGVAKTVTTPAKAKASRVA